MTTIGIDLGTTNSLVSVWKDNKPIIIPNIFNKHLTPSVISVAEDNTILVGDIAKERLITHPELTCSNFKRYMGSNKEFTLGSYKFTAEELSSFILKSLKSDAEHYLDEEITDAVISVPAYFNDSQRKATKLAGELAGLKVERLISEPTAAAIAYGLHEENDDSQFLVFDLGGGTFDVSILELFDGVMEVKSIAGDNYLGGEDFNNLLIDYFLQENKLKIDKLSPKTISALHKQAEICKITLSNTNEYEMLVYIDDTKYSLTIDRAKFESLSKDLLLRIKHPINRALNDAGIKSKDLDSIILIGGSTRIPFIKSTVTRIFNKLPFSTINPDETVAMGAAIQAALKERKSELKEIILTDVCPYTLGVEVIDHTNNSYNAPGLFLPIIERNSPIPISREKLVTTCYDNQTYVTINVFQGERRHVDENIKLGELKIEVPASPAGKEAISLRYTYDINGLLEIEATVLSNKHVQSVVIENSPGSMTKEEIKERLEKLKEIKIHPRDKQENKLILARGERLYEESLGSIRNYISELLSTFEAALDSQDTAIIKKAAKNITEKFDELEDYSKR